MNPLEELKSLDLQVDQVADLAGLKPIFYRLDEIARQHVNDFEVQLVVGDIKQHLVNRGTVLQQSSPQPGPPPMGPPPLGGGPPPMPGGMQQGQPGGPPPMPGPTPVDIVPPRRVSPDQFAPQGGPPPQPPYLPQQGTPYPPPMPQGSPMGSGQTPGYSTGGGMPPPSLPSSGSYDPGTQLLPGSGSHFHGSNSPPTGSNPTPTGSNLAAQHPGTSWKRAMWLGAIVGLIVAGGGGYFIVKKLQNGGDGKGAVVLATIATNPPGASVRINGDTKCTSDCQIQLEPGDYQVTAFLDGYEAAASALTVKKGETPSLNLTLEPQSQTVRVLTDLAQGKVKLDDQPEVDLMEGQFVLEKVPPGPHTLAITGPTGQATVAFELGIAKLPVVTGPITVRNLLAVAVATFTGQAHITTSSGPLKMTVNGQTQGDASPGGVDVTGYQPGVSEIMLGEGAEQKSVKENFTPAPALTLFLKSDENIGTLIVSTGTESDVRVFVNNRENPKRTARGELRIRTIGQVNVRVAKDGFDAPPPQMAQVKKGGEVRLDFAIKPAAQFSSLQIRGGTIGADVIVDSRLVGAIGPDGNFSNSSILPGMHVIELRRDQFQTRRFERDFRAGQPVIITGQDAILVSDRPQPPVVPPPPPVETTKVIPPPPPKPPPPAPPKVFGISDFEQPEAWRQVEGVWTHKGAAYLTFKPVGRGTYNFTIHLVRGGSIFRSGKVRWFVDFTNTSNYALFEMDDKNFWDKDVVNGKSTEKARTEHKQGEKTWTIQLEVSPERVVHKMQANGMWYNLDTWEQPGRDFSDGKFGFWVQGSDEISLSDFKFTAPAPAR